MRIISFEVATCELPQPPPALVIKQPKTASQPAKGTIAIAMQTYGELVMIPLMAKHCQRHRFEMHRNFLKV
jgi:hypothetical protein